MIVQRIVRSPENDDGTGSDRREFLKRAGVSALTASAGIMPIFTMPPSIPAADTASKGAPHAEKLGWRLGCQAWTFNRFTLFEAIDKTAELGLKYIEAFPHGQKLSPTNSAIFGPKLSADHRQEVKKYLADKGVLLVNMGVGPYDKEAFDFAKDMGMETLVSEPKFGDFDAIDFSMEYEHKFTMPELAQCVAYFDKVAAELSKD